MASQNYHFAFVLSPFALAIITTGILIICLLKNKGDPLKVSRTYALKYFKIGYF